MDSFPSELIQEILNWVEPSSRVNCSEVCWTWYELMNGLKKDFLTDGDYKNAYLKGDIYNIVRNPYRDLLEEAYLSGSIPLMNLILRKGTEFYYEAYNNACFEGNVQMYLVLARYFEKYCKKKVIVRCCPFIKITSLSECINNMFRRACNSGEPIIVEDLIRKGATSFSVGFEYAAFRGHLNILKLLVSKGVTNVDYAISNARSAGRNDIVEYLEQVDAFEKLKKSNLVQKKLEIKSHRLIFKEIHKQTTSFRLKERNLPKRSLQQ